MTALRPVLVEGRAKKRERLVIAVLRRGRIAARQHGANADRGCGRLGAGPNSALPIVAECCGGGELRAEDVTRRNELHG
jgi:hypothetical protein